MILIADSGSSKTDWILCRESTTTSFQTIGLNPLIISSENFIKQSQSFLNKEQRSRVSRICFFGAGCAHHDIIEKVTADLKLSFKNAQISVASDLMAACIAVCGNQKGMVSILGTGANLCYFDGKDIHQKTAPLGYVLGDEASGANFGKALLQAYFYQELPKDLIEPLEEKFDLQKANVLEKIYRSPLPNKYLAAFFPFILENKNHPYLKQLIRLRFDEFFKRHVYKYQEALSLPLHFVGSVGFLLQSELKDYLKSNEMEVGSFIQSPKDGLIKNLASVLEIVK